MVIKSRRIMYLHHILTRNDNSLILIFFKAQNKYPLKDDWSETVKKDLNDFNINIEFNALKQMSKRKF